MGERAHIERVALTADLGRVGARRNEHTNDVDATHVVLWSGPRAEVRAWKTTTKMISAAS